MMKKTRQYAALALALAKGKSNLTANINGTKVRIAVEVRGK